MKRRRQKLETLFSSRKRPLSKLKRWRLLKVVDRDTEAAAATAAAS